MVTTTVLRKSRGKKDTYMKREVNKDGYPTLKDIIAINGVGKEISLLIGISVMNLNEILSGQNNRDFNTRDAIIICTFLDLTPDECFY